MTDYPIIFSAEAIARMDRFLHNSDEAQLPRHGSGTARAIEAYLSQEVSVEALANTAPDLETAITLNAMHLYNLGFRFSNPAYKSSDRGD